MKISVNWLKQFADIDISTEELVEKIGAQLGAVEEVIDLGKKYQGIVIAKVISCVKHENADKLSVCLIDDGGVVQGVERGENNYVQVVCGAPNVREGMLVAWLPPGATVPSSFDKDPFVLDARDLRGVKSNGMLASASELALTDDHSGLLEIDIDADPGTSFAEIYDLNDIIIDIENKMFTHRPDCFGILGVAREIAGIQGKQFVSPEWYEKSLDRIKPGKSAVPLVVRNDNPELIPRFMAIAMADITMGPSPIIIQTYLSRVGLRPINNIVDVTNYLMYLTGQPLHAYDYDKVKALSGPTPTLVARVAADNEGVSLLNGKTVHVDAPTVVIATDQQPIGIGGVMGGADTEVDENTKNIILECATFDLYNIRRTSMKYGLFTDAVTRFNKGQSPYQNERVLEEAVATVQYVSGGHVASAVFDAGPALPGQSPVSVDAAFINTRLGFNLDAETAATTLQNVEFRVDVHNSTLSVLPPFWRTDIGIAEDIVEEVGRLIGFDKLPLLLPFRTLKPADKNAELELKKTIRQLLATAGANEVLTYSFAHGNMLQKAGQDNTKAFKLSNALSPDLQYYRLSLTPSLLEKVHANVKSGHAPFVIFELGKVHQVGQNDPHEPSVPAEKSQLALVIADDKARGNAYYSARKYLTNLLGELHSVPGAVQFEAFEKLTEEQIATPYEPARSACVTLNGEVIGVVGEYKSGVRKAFKLPNFTAGFEINLEALRHQVVSSYVPLPKYPKVEQDISLKVPATLSYAQVFNFIWDELGSVNPENTLPTLSPVDIYQRSDDTDNKQITLRFTIASYERTLTAVEVNELLDTVAAKAKDAFGAERL
jgi:phenylalanyl-tRNA synthetase beta chain